MVDKNEWWHGVQTWFLDLLTGNKAPTLFGDGVQLITPSMKSEIPKVDKHNAVDIAQSSLDVIIMNPPFTRPTGHEVPKKVSTTRFAGLGTSEKEPKRNGQKLRLYLNSLEKDQDILASHGNAGLGSNFMDLAHVKLKPGGVWRSSYPLPLFQVMPGLV